MFVIAGVSGNTGKVVASTLLAEKQPVRVIVRKASEAGAWKARGAEVAILDLDDVAQLTEALRGAQGAYLLLPPQMQSTDARTENARRAAGYVKAIHASGIPHVVFLSSIGAQLTSGTGPITSLHDAEVALKDSRATVTVVRAAYFMENWGGSLYGLAQGQLPSFLTIDRVIPMVATDDIGRNLARALLEGAKASSVIELSGPRDYSPVDVAAALARVTGKPVQAVQGPEEAMVPALTGAGFNAHWAGLYQELTHASNAGTLVFEGGSARATRGTTEIEVVLKRLVGA
jgi:uncharacterized protein YbjT (DUF2867 family)